MADTIFDLRAIGEQFCIEGKFVSAAREGTGHINDTFCANYTGDGGTFRVIHQRINHRVFPAPDELMDNVTRVTAHIRAKQPQFTGAEQSRRVLTLIPSRSGGDVFRDEAKNWWRTYVFIEGARTHDVMGSVDMAQEAARAFGRFQRLLIDLPTPRLYETIPDFHNTPKRFTSLIAAMERDAEARVAEVQTELDFVREREPRLSRLIDLQGTGEIPERITHNDTKINNVMIDNATSEGICVIDLDTVMPGLALYDFGDMVRTVVSTAVEDERDLSKVAVELARFEALVSGYLDGCGGMLTEAELAELTFSGWLLTMENGIRFLTDFLEGDVYYKTHRDGHNLDRCRCQFKLARELEGAWDGMEAIVARYRDP